MSLWSLKCLIQWGGVPVAPVHLVNMSGVHLLQWFNLADLHMFTLTKYSVLVWAVCSVWFFFFFLTQDKFDLNFKVV